LGPHRLTRQGWFALAGGPPIRGSVCPVRP